MLHSRHLHKILFLNNGIVLNSSVTKFAKASIGSVTTYVENNRLAYGWLATVRGGRGVITLAMAGISPAEMIYLCDQNSASYGFFTPVTHIPIVNPDHVYLEPVSELVVFSYAYLDEIRQHLRQFVENGGRLTSILELI